MSALCLVLLCAVLKSGICKTIQHDRDHLKDHRVIKRIVTTTKTTPEPETQTSEPREGIKGTAGQHLAEELNLMSVAFGKLTSERFGEDRPHDLTHDMSTYVLELFKIFTKGLGAVTAASTLAYTLHLPVLSPVEQEIKREEYSSIFEQLQYVHVKAVEIDLNLRIGVYEAQKKLIKEKMGSRLKEDNVKRALMMLYNSVIKTFPGRYEIEYIKNPDPEYDEQVAHFTPMRKYRNIQTMLTDRKMYEELQDFCNFNIRHRDTQQTHRNTVDLLKRVLHPAHDNDTIMWVHAKDSDVSFEDSMAFAQVVISAIARAFYTSALCHGVQRRSPTESAALLAFPGTLAADAVIHTFHTIYEAYEKYDVSYGCEGRKGRGDKRSKDEENKGGKLGGDGHGWELKKNKNEKPIKSPFRHYTQKDLAIEACELGVEYGLSEQAVVQKADDDTTSRDTIISQLSQFVAYVDVQGVTSSKGKLMFGRPVSLTKPEKFRLAYTGSVRVQTSIKIPDFSVALHPKRDYAKYKRLVFYHEVPVNISIKQQRAQCKESSANKCDDRLLQWRYCKHNHEQSIMVGTFKAVNGLKVLNGVKGIFRYSTDTADDDEDETDLTICSGSESVTARLHLNQAEIKLSGHIDPALFTDVGNVIDADAAAHFEAAIAESSAEISRLRELKKPVVEEDRTSFYIAVGVGSSLGLLVLIALVAVVVVVVMRRRSAAGHDEVESSKHSVIAVAKEKKRKSQEQGTEDVKKVKLKETKSPVVKLKETKSLGKVKDMKSVGTIKERKNSMATVKEKNKSMTTVKERRGSAKKSGNQGKRRPSKGGK